MSDKNYYTTIEAAKALGVSVRTVQLWVENGSLKAWKTAGGHRRIVAESVQQHIDQQNTETKPKASKNKRVLIVEDNPTVAKFYEAVINSWSKPIDVIVKEDGFAGLLDIGNIPPDVIISDIYMPGMDGLQMIRSLYKSNLLNSDQINLISGLPNESILERGGVPSGVEFYSKPVDVEALKEVLFSKLGFS